MSISAAIRRMLEAGLTIEQALIAAEAMEQEIKPVRTARQDRKLDVSFLEWQGLRQSVFNRDNFACVYCGTDVSDAPQCDHVFPLAQGGKSNLENLATACKRCNSSKRDLSLSDWKGAIQ